MNEPRDLESTAEESETNPRVLDGLASSVPLEDETKSPPQLGNYLLRVDRKLHFLRAAAVGILSGGVAVLFQLSLDVADRGRLAAFDWFAHTTYGGLFPPLIAALLAGVAGYLTQRFAPSASGSGIPHIRAVLARKGSIDWKRLLPVKFVGGVLAIGSGLSLGREGPTVQMGAAVGAAFSDVAHLDRRSKRNLIASAAGAGLGAAFNAPLAGFIFVIEELQRELSPLTFVSALIASVTSVAISRIFTGQLPSFHIRNYPLPPIQALPLFALMGLVCGYAGVIFNRSIIGAVRFSRGLKLQIWQKTAIAGAITGLVGLWLPEALGGGHRVAESLLMGTFLPAKFIEFLLMLLVVKFGLTIVGYSSGAPGGIFAPLLVLGAIIGTLFGHLSVLFFPNVSATPAAYAVVAMAAMFTSIVRAPLTGIVLILEMTGNQEQLFALILTCLIAYLVAENLKSTPVYDALLELDMERENPELTTRHEEPHIFLVSVASHSFMDGCQLGDVKLPPSTVIISIRRGSEEWIASPDFELHAGDLILVAGLHSSEDHVRSLAVAG